MIKQTIGMIYVTNDYDQFTLLNGNRGLNPQHLNRLKKSIQEEQLIVPLLVNEKLQIIDGQHRFTVCRDLELPVYYIIVEGYGLKQCQRVNSTLKKWSPEDYLNGYCDLGYEEYITFKEFREKYPYLSFKISQILLFGGQSTDFTNKFNNGELTIEDYSKACDIAEKIGDFKNYVPSKLTYFQLALYQILKHDNYNHERMLQKLAYLGHRLVRMNDVASYEKVLQEIYNYKTVPQDRVYFY